MIDSSALALVAISVAQANAQQKRSVFKADFEVLTTMIVSWLVPHECNGLLLFL
jgi:hypothetical protein